MLLKQVLEVIRAKRYIPLALLSKDAHSCSMTEMVNLLATECSLPVVAQHMIATSPPAQAQNRPSAVVAAASSAMIHYGTVRSGQQIYAEGRSLVVIGTVNSGTGRVMLSYI